MEIKCGRNMDTHNSEFETSMVILPAFCPSISTSKNTLGLSARLKLDAADNELTDAVGDWLKAEGQYALYSAYPTPPTAVPYPAIIAALLADMIAIKP